MAPSFFGIPVRVAFAVVVTLQLLTFASHVAAQSQWGEPCSSDADCVVPNSGVQRCRGGFCCHIGESGGGCASCAAISGHCTRCTSSPSCCTLVDPNLCGSGCLASGTQPAGAICSCDFSCTSRGGTSYNQCRGYRCCDKEYEIGCSACDTEGKCYLCSSGYTLVNKRCVVGGSAGTSCSQSSECLSGGGCHGRCCKAGKSEGCTSCNAAGDCDACLSSHELIDGDCVVVTPSPSATESATLTSTVTVSTTGTLPSSTSVSISNSGTAAKSATTSKTQSKIQSPSTSIVATDSRPVSPSLTAAMTQIDNSQRASSSHSSLLSATTTVTPPLAPLRPHTPSRNDSFTLSAVTVAPPAPLVPRTASRSQPVTHSAVATMSVTASVAPHATPAPGPGGDTTPAPIPRSNATPAPVPRDWMLSFTVNCSVDPQDILKKLSDFTGLPASAFSFVQTNETCKNGEKEFSISTDEDAATKVEHLPREDLKDIGVIRFAAEGPGSSAAPEDDDHTILILATVSSILALLLIALIAVVLRKRKQDERRHAIDVPLLDETMATSKGFRNVRRDEELLKVKAEHDDILLADPFGSAAPVVQDNSLSCNPMRDSFFNSVNPLPAEGSTAGSPLAAGAPLSSAGSPLTSPKAPATPDTASTPRSGSSSSTPAPIYRAADMDDLL